jgi:hypothetical protein
VGLVGIVRAGRLSAPGCGSGCPRVADGAVADAVRLLGRLRDDLGAAGLQFGLKPREDPVEVGGGQVDAEVAALAIISRRVRRSSSVRPGLAAGGCRTMDVSGWSAGPTVIQRIPLYPTSSRTSKSRVSR